MTSTDILLEIVGSLDPGLSAENIRYTLYRDDTTLHLATAGDPFTVLILEALHEPVTCRHVEAVIEEFTHRELAGFTLCPECLAVPTALVFALVDEDLRDACHRYLATPQLRPADDVVGILTAETATHPRPASALVSRYAALRTMLSGRLRAAVPHEEDAYHTPLLEHAARTRATLEMIHQRLFGTTTLHDRILAEHGATAPPATIGHGIVVVEALGGDAVVDGDSDPQRTTLALGELLLAVHAPQSLGADGDTVAVVPANAVAALLAARPEQVRAVVQGLAEDVIDTALRLHEPDDPESIYHDLDTCVEAARSIHA